MDNKNTTKTAATARARAIAAGNDEMVALADVAAIALLRTEAAAAGDLEMVAICDRVFDSGCPDAVAICLAVIRDTEAMDDGDEG